MRNTTRRSWLRLVGRRHDLQHWDADTERTPAPAVVTKAYTPNMAAGLPHGWVAAAFEPVRKRFFANHEGSWTFSGVPNEVFAVLNATTAVAVLECSDDDALKTSKYI